MYFRNYRLRKTWLDKCLKIPVSEDSWTVKIASGLKHCCNLNDSTFSTFLIPVEVMCVGESLF